MVTTDGQYNNKSSSKNKRNFDNNEEPEFIESELFYDGETEQEIASTLPYKLILGLIVLAIALFFLYIFISSVGKQ